jgi:hypothetical protein
MAGRARHAVAALVRMLSAWLVDWIPITDRLAVGGRKGGTTVALPYDPGVCLAATR